eukprot:TRINITY_DN6557_c0_g1_i1.p2 TRINITY_DN6557_c0_g1~~TRINITY_DN6557_c0_g1_i1.p2  ORF type:complete len:160 (-),score=22.34 TRINITY_DN6557_c0_g1_i1:69-548(-)
MAKGSEPLRSVTCKRTEILETRFNEEHPLRKKQPRYKRESGTSSKKDKSTDSNDEQFSRKLLPKLVTFDKADIFEISFKKKHLSKKPLPIHVTLTNGDKSTDSKDEHCARKYPSILETFDKADIFEISVKEEHACRNPSFKHATLTNGDKSTDSKDEHW